jgi:hypothetical protein
MRMRCIIFNLVVVALCFHGCTGPDVKTDFDPSADFSKFHTFAFLGLTDINREGDILDNSLTRKRIESIVARELTKKGLQQVEVGQHPDLLVIPVGRTAPTVGAGAVPHTAASGPTITRKGP